MSRAPSGKLSEKFGRRSGARARPQRTRGGGRPAGVEALEDRCLFALTVTPYGGATNGTPLVQQLLLPSTGINVTSAVFVGQTGQAGTFSGFDFQIPNGRLRLPNGVLLTTGRAADVPGNNDLPDNTTQWGTPGDIQLDPLAGDTTRDANSLTITFTAAADVKSILFDFIYGSEEFPEFVGSDFNDAFGAFLDGRQISFDALNQPITVNNNFFQFNNSGLTEADDPNVAGKVPIDIDIEYDGLTPQIRTAAPLDTTLTTHTLKFTIADARDLAFDSGVFLSQLQGSPTVITQPTTGLPEPGVFRIDLPSYVVDETRGSIDITIDRVGGSEGAISVDVTTTDGTATAGQDYTPVTTTLNFATGQTSQTVTIPLLDDTLAEGDETFQVTITRVTGEASISTPGSATVTIRDNEPGVKFSQTRYSVAEGTPNQPATAFITVQRVGPPEIPFSVQFSTTNGTATEQDYMPVVTTLAFAAGETAKTVPIQVYSDFVDEGTETVNLVLTGPTTPVSLGNGGTAVLEILNTERVFSISRTQFVTNGSKIEGVALRFTRPLNQPRAEDVNNYDLYEVRERRFGGAPARRRLTIASASYDPVSSTVILRPTKRLKDNQFYEVNAYTSRETGIRSTTFETLDGDLNGTPGTGSVFDPITGFIVSTTTDDYLAYLVRGNRFQYFDRGGDEVRLNLKGPGKMELFRSSTRIADELRMLATDGTASVLTGSVKRGRGLGGAGADGRAVIDQLTGTPVRNELNPAQFEVHINRLGEP